MSIFKSGLSDKSIELDASRLRVLLTSIPMPLSSRALRLANNSSMSATTVDLTYLPDGAAVETAWIIVDPYTNDCEIRKVEGISGRTITIAALDHAHAAGDPIIWTPFPVWNVHYFGAKGDGSTDDTTAITAAIGDIPSTGGKLYFPAGKYVTSGGFTIANPTVVMGDDRGRAYGEDYVSQITCTSAAAVLFTVTADKARFSHLSLVNTAVSTPSAGSGIKCIHASLATQQVDYDFIDVSNFYDDIDVTTGNYWTMYGCHITNPVRYGVRIQNTVNGDIGDWTIDGTSFLVNANTPTAAIRMESSGGGKITNCKVNGAFDYGIDVAIAAGVSTSILLITNNSIENVDVDGIRVTNAATGAFSQLSITGNQVGLYNSTGNAITMSANALGDITYVQITGNIFTGNSGSSQYAVDLTNIRQITFTGNNFLSFAELLTWSNCDFLHMNETRTVRVYRSTAQSIPNITNTAIAFDSETYDAHNMHSTVSNTSRLTAVMHGKYHIYASIRFAANATGYRYVQLRVDGTTYIAADKRAALASGTQFFTVSTEINLALGQYAELIVYQDSGGSLNVDATSYSPIFGMTLVG